MENLYTGLLIAAVSGLTFIAYKHPRLYEKEFSSKIFYTSLGALLVAIFHDTGVSTAHESLLPLIIENQDKEVQSALKTTRISEHIYLLCICSLIYSGFLSWLANHMQTEREENKNG